MRLAAHKKRAPLHPLERLLLGSAAVQLGFTCWAFGGSLPWAQIVALALAVPPFLFALWPRRYGPDESELGAHRMTMWPRLRRFPLFWLGLSLVFLLLVQAANPSWRWQHNSTGWWMTPTPSVSWLPTSTDTPYVRYNIWRMFVIYATAWLMVCALWTGITRRWSLQLLLGLLVGNALVLSVAGFIQQESGTTKVLWLREFPGAHSFASFVYRNHGGAYLGLMVSAALALAFWHYYEGRRRLARSTPAAVWLLGSLLLMVAVIFSFSRGAIITTGIFAVSSGFAFLLLRTNSPVPSTTPRIITLALAVMVAGCFGFILRNTDLSGATRRFEELFRLREQEESFLSRKLARERAAVMLQEHWVRGTGAGSFRFLFPFYIRNDPYLFEGGRVLWDHAHIDWLEIPIEQGLPGVLLIAAAFGWCLRQWWRLRGWTHPVAFMLLLGCLQTLGHALIDFPFQNLAILVMWWALLIIALRWLEFDTAQ